MDHFPIATETLNVITSQARDYGKQFHDRYKNAEPFPNICIDDFLPEQILRDFQEKLSLANVDADESFSSPQENLKSSYLPEKLHPECRNLFYIFNSRPFIAFVEAMTGIRGLIPDPMFIGAGIHELKNGGHLNIHADFNFHKKLNLERRINILIYLNDDWKEEYGGQVEFWSTDMKSKVQSFTPEFNRCVVFNTTSNSFHGNPNPVNHPHGTTRRSIALYYYTATWDESKKSHTTLFQPRPDTADKKVNTVKFKQLVKDLTPPMIYRQLIKLKKSTE